MFSQFDIGETDQTCCLLEPRLAMDSIPLLDSLLSLFLRTLGGPAELKFGEQSILPADPNNSSIDISRNALTFAFITLPCHFITPPTLWQSPSNKNMGFDALDWAPFQEQHPSVALAVSWVMLRLSKSTVAGFLYQDSPYLRCQRRTCERLSNLQSLSDRFHKPVTSEGNI